MSDQPESPVKVKKKRGNDGSRHPLLEGRKSNVWHGDIAHLMKYYPKTQEAYDRLVERGRANFAKIRASGRKISRAGVPDGWGGRGEYMRPLKELAKLEARILIEYLRKEDLLVDPDNKIANEALECAIALHRNPDSAGALKLAAARTVLEWTRAKPAQKIDQTVRKAEDFLADLAALALPKGD